MISLGKIEDWGNRHHPAIFDVVRILLGFFLLLKGCAFLNNLTYLEHILSEQELTRLSSGAIVFIVSYVILIHICGGALLMIGIYTRIVSALQLPVLICAVFVINIFKSPFNTELWSSIICGVLLLVFMVIGSGKFSLDHYLSKIKPVN